MTSLLTLLRQCNCSTTCQGDCRAATLNLNDNTLVPTSNATSPTAFHKYVSDQKDSNFVFARCTSAARPAQTFKFVFVITEEADVVHVLAKLLQRVIAFATSRCDVYAQYFAIRRKAINALPGQLSQLIKVFQANLVYLIIMTKWEDLTAGEEGKKIDARQKGPYGCHLIGEES